MGFLRFFKDDVAGSGYKPMRPKTGTRVHTPVFTGDLPPRVDLRPFMTAVEDQGDTNSCSANAVAGAGEFLLKQEMGNQAYDLSRLFLYYNGRSREGGRIADNGSVLQYVVEGLSDLGVCPERVWPFEAGLVNRKPVEEAYHMAQRFRVSGAESVPVDAAVWKRTLAAGNPIIFGTDLYESFDEATPNGGFVPMPAPGAVGRETHGGHAMLCVGYSEPENVFIVRNSWGPEWGLKGYCYMHANYLANPNLTNDTWALLPQGGAPPAKLGWVTDGSPLSDRKVQVPVYEPGAYKDAGNFYDRPDWSVLAYAAIPVVYDAVKSLFFSENASLADFTTEELERVSASAADDEEEDEDEDDNWDEDDEEDEDGDDDEEDEDEDEDFDDDEEEDEEGDDEDDDEEEEDEDDEEDDDEDVDDEDLDDEDEDEEEEDEEDA